MPRREKSESIRLDTNITIEKYFWIRKRNFSGQSKKYFSISRPDRFAEKSTCDEAGIRSREHALS
jgi:hypothetical protein